MQNFRFSELANELCSSFYNEHGFHSTRISVLSQALDEKEDRKNLSVQSAFVEDSRLLEFLVGGDVGHEVVGVVLVVHT